ncbi:hypothetical protein RDABS01_039715 [Bienertia sinuspersici]
MAHQFPLVFLASILFLLVSSTMANLCLNTLLPNANRINCSPKKATRLTIVAILHEIQSTTDSITHLSKQPQLWTREVNFLYECANAITNSYSGSLHATQTTNHLGGGNKAVKESKRLSMEKDIKAVLTATKTCTTTLRNLRARSDVISRCSQDGYVRLNTIGASKSNLGPVGAGGIIRRSRGECFEMFMVNCWVCSSVWAELLAVQHGLYVAWSSGHIYIQLTLDSELVIRFLLEEPQSSSPHFHIVKRCRELLDHEGWQVFIHHSYREANPATNWLAKLGVGGSPKISVFHEPPATLCSILLEDMCGVFLRRTISAVAA